ncbi:unnamed protein product [Schistocephalus solidus]|uniref:Uncharacterized protein n=1 Tax=Schistocephalus solidus TaxID=70667 RepID=A0A183SXQ8_SCHSO|nr:unnamed protein product [Schistocephalus solidus]
MPATRLRVRLRSLIPRQKAEEGVGQQETVFCTRAQKKEAVIITHTETVGTQLSLPGRFFHPDASVEVNKDNLFVHLRRSHQQGVQILEELFLLRVRARHWKSVGTDDGDELVSPKKQAEAHKAIIHNLRKEGQTSYDAVRAGKRNTNIASLCLWPAALEEGVAGPTSSS